MTHGTNANYHAGCHCWRCRRGAAHYRATLRGGGHVRVDATEVCAHVRTMLGCGHTVESISHATGLDHNTIKELAHGERRTVFPRTADAVLATPIDTAPTDGLIPRGPTLRLLQEMRRAGIKRRDIEAMLGVSRLEPERWQSVRERTYRRVRVLYELLARQGIVPASVLEEVS